MSMWLVSISADNIDRVLLYPPLFWQIFEPAHPSSFHSAARSHRSQFGMPTDARGLMSRILQPMSGPLSLADGEGERAFLSDAWRLIDGLLAKGRKQRAVQTFLSGGQLVPGLKIPLNRCVRLHRSNVVAATQRQFAAISNGALALRCDDRLWRRHGPSARDVEDTCPWEYLWRYLEQMRAVLNHAADGMHGIAVIR